MRLFRAIAGALAVLSSGFAAAHGQTVVDANGRTVGTMVGFDTDDQYVTRTISSSIVIAFLVTRDGLFNLGLTPEYKYASADCSGPAYLDADLDVLIQRAIFIPPNQDDRWSTRGRLIYGGTPRVRIAIYSARSKFNYNIGDGPCTPMDGEMMSVRPVVEHDVASWRLKAPFKFK